MMKIRESAVAGSFYADDKNELFQEISGYLKNSRAENGNLDTRMLICPHAGYIFSGQIAADAISHLSKNKTKRIFILAAAHHFGFRGISVNQQSYETPLGLVKNDTEISEALLGEKFIDYYPEAHTHEHCIEVELPILQVHLQNFTLIPILFGACSENDIDLLAKRLEKYAENPENAFIVSTDFSHYPNNEDASKIDKLTADAIVSGDSEQLKQCLWDHDQRNINELHTALCGEKAVLCAMKIAKQANLNWEIISYANSGDSFQGNSKSVVGYYAIRAGKTINNEFQLSKNEKQKLLNYARAVIRHKLAPEKHDLPTREHLPNALFEAGGAFVTLHKGEKLRGCIGRFSDENPLIENVHKMAISAAFQDPRFEPLQKSELDEISIEISVLTPLQRIEGPNDFVLGKHGIYIIKRDENGNITNSGTFLPQVAQSQNWTKAEFLGFCARDKAGIGWDGWKDAELYRYNALIFSEKEIL
ncbi:MAG: AmmeMemoRadiSam system protein B [Bacteroidales bacterium]|jgi:AmmeMemoRadiSam system protein B/AmmeMemoRadiSam system protein A|nr:AmmeMemoRadiSam system protein B [Bacteroidales bacterium]